MDEINVMDRVRIVRSEGGGSDPQAKFGRVVMIADGKTCIVQLDDGGVATVDVSQLKKIV